MLDKWTEDDVFTLVLGVPDLVSTSLSLQPDGHAILCSLPHIHCNLMVTQPHAPVFMVALG